MRGEGLGRLEAGEALQLEESHQVGLGDCWQQGGEGETATIEDCALKKEEDWVRYTRAASLPWPPPTQWRRREERQSSLGEASRGEESTRTTWGGWCPALPTCASLSLPTISLLLPSLSTSLQVRRSLRFRLELSRYNLIFIVLKSNKPWGHL